MVSVLVLRDDGDIRGWLVDEPIESAEAHIRNGYPELLEGWLAGTVKAEVIDVPDEDAFKGGLYGVIDGRSVWANRFLWQAGGI